MNIKGYNVSVRDPVFEVDEEDWKSWPDKRYFERVEAPEPEQVKAEGPPLDKPVTIDPTDGISTEEAIMAEQALVKYRQERTTAKQERLMAVESQDWQDYYEAAQDDESD
jgi:hypothetical protein